MPADLFISYAWGSPEAPSHRNWVRQLAAATQAVGFDVLIDADVDYGASLNGFMRRATESQRVLMIVDENYIDRADNCSKSGVAIENKWIRDARPSKPDNWLGVVFIDNPNHNLPSWISEENPKGFDFNIKKQNDYPGSEQIDELWRWIEGLPANQAHAVTARALRQRARRLERIDNLRDPSHWRNPKSTGEVEYNYMDAPQYTYTFGYGDHEFGFHVSSDNKGCVKVYCDPIRAVGINRDQATELEEIEQCIGLCRVVVASIGDEIILLNCNGRLCLVQLLAVQHDDNGSAYIPASIKVAYRILDDS